MFFSNPPSYDDVIKDDLVFGKPDDLARAASVVANSRIFAALRPSEAAINNAQVSSRNLIRYFRAVFHELILLYELVSANTQFFFNFFIISIIIPRYLEAQTVLL